MNRKTKQVANIELNMANVSVKPYDLAIAMSAFRTTNFKVARDYLCDGVDRLSKEILERITASLCLNVRELVTQSSIPYRENALIPQNQWLKIKLKYLKDEIMRITEEIGAIADLDFSELNQQTKYLEQLIKEVEIKEKETIKRITGGIDIENIKQLNREDLAARLKKSAGTISYQAKCPSTFPKWSKSHDPQGIAWEYVPRVKGINSFPYFKPILN